MNHVTNFLLSLVFVPKCISCGKTLSPNSALCLCDPCREGLSEQLKITCEKCGRPISGRGPDNFCASCRKSRYRFQRLFGASLYEGNMRRALIRYKFHRRTGAAKTFGFLIAECYKALGLSGAEVVSYVPLHPRRLHMRGFHQTRLLAEHAGKALGLPVEPLLKKAKNTKPQSSLKGKERRQNIRGSFEALKGSHIKGRHVLLIDDIATTNMTTDECARILIGAGAKAVTVGVVAVTPPPNQ